MRPWETIETLINLVVDQPGSSIEKTFLSLLDRLAFQLSEPHSTEPPQVEQFPSIDYFAIRAAVETAFPNWGFYNVAGDITNNIGECEIHVGDAIDDVTDIIIDLKTAYWYYQNESEKSALWYLLNSYASHWKGHMRSLQFYVHHLETGQ